MYVRVCIQLHLVLSLLSVWPLAWSLTTAIWCPRSDWLWLANLWSICKNYCWKLSLSPFMFPFPSFRFSYEFVCRWIYTHLLTIPSLYSSVFSSTLLVNLFLSDLPPSSHSIAGTGRHRFEKTFLLVPSNKLMYFSCYMLDLLECIFVTTVIKKRVSAVEIFVFRQDTKWVIYS